MLFKDFHAPYVPCNKILGETIISLKITNIRSMKNNLKLITQLTRDRARHDDVGWNFNLSRIRNSLFHIFIVSKK